MIEKFLDIAYYYYPRGVNYFTPTRNENINYIKSIEYLRLKNERNAFFNKGPNYGKFLIKTFEDAGVEIEFRDATNIKLGDRAFCVQHSGFFFEDILKYHPLCFVFSGIIPYFHYYFLDIDISLENKESLGSYSWLKNNGVLNNWEENNSYLELVNSISNIIINKLNYNEFPKFLLMKTIPDINSNNLEFGEFTFFNAFFADDFFCLP